MKTFSVLITNNAAVVGEEIEENEVCVSLRTYCNHVCDTMTTCLSQFLVVFCRDILEEVSWHQTKRVPSFFLVTQK